ncbi:unnamed protein product [Nippostrongylus brasiliensis]|uniref:Reverse transcriptase domain-containing protein n=1 Tax=Nippostrongylus brasiliensis TaxID=27835 RepID=A0A0N4XTS6_NIPBR|nr:unnamed protein product [Nippostrongylus brasiliensis]
MVSALTNELARRQRKARAPPSKAYLDAAKLYGVSQTIQVQSLLRKLKDELHIAQLEIQRIKETLRRYKERRRGYPAVAKEPRDSTVQVPVEEVRDYWREIVGRHEPFTPSPELVEWSRREGRPPEQTNNSLSEESWKDIFAKVKPSKATGPDGIQGFWWKHLPEAKLRLKQWCEYAINRPRKAITRWLCRGRVVLIPKAKEGQRGPGDFRPIACLNTCYKILTGMLTRQIFERVADRFPLEQVAMRKGVWGCTHAHILDQTVCKDAQRRKRELHMLWVDMTKAFDSVSHNAVRWTLAKLGRDTLSPLLFCLAIMPISDWIRNNVSPYRTATGAGRGASGPMEIGHICILYMDDLKVYTTSF